MATRPIWRGHLRLALVSCPVALHSAVRSSGDLHFHLINPKTGHRVRLVTLDAETDEEVSRRDLVKGYEFEKDRYVLLEEEDFEQAKIETVIHAGGGQVRARATSIPPVFSIPATTWCRTARPVRTCSWYCATRSPDRAAPRCPASSSPGGSARWRSCRWARGWCATRCTSRRDLYDSKPLFEPIGEQAPDREMVDLASQLIERQQGGFEPADTEDRYETRLRAVIAAKLKGEGITPEQPEAPRRDNVIDLMAALKASLGRGEREAAPGSAAQDGDAQEGPRQAARTGAAPGLTAAAPAARRTGPPARPHLRLVAADQSTSWREHAHHDVGCSAATPPR